MYIHVGEGSSMRECLRKEIKKTGGQLAIIFSSEDVRVYKLKKGKRLRITIETIPDGE
jgi:hypothetical protein